jgi:hypothetical protein
VLAKGLPVESIRGAPTLPALPKLNRAEPSAKQESLGPGWNHTVHEEHVVRATSPTDHQPTSGPITETRTQRDVTNSSKKARMQLAQRHGRP